MNAISNYLYNLNPKTRATFIGLFVLTLFTNALYSLPQALNFFLIVGVFVLVYHLDSIRYATSYEDEYETELIEEEQEPVRKVSKKK